MPELRAAAGFAPTARIRKPSEDRFRIHQTTADGDQRQQEAEVQVEAVAEQLGHGRGLVHRQRLRVHRVGRLQQALLRQREEDQVVGDVVEHDRQDHLVRAGARLEVADQPAPDGRGQHAGQDRQGQVDRPGQVELVADPAGRRAGEQHLPAAADVEQRGPERQAHAQPGRDQRPGELQRLGQRPDLGGEVQRRAALAAGVEDRPAEQRRVGAPDRVPGGGEEVAGSGGDVAERSRAPARR